MSENLLQFIFIFIQALPITITAKMLTYPKKLSPKEVMALVLIHLIVTVIYIFAYRFYDNNIAISLINILLVSVFFLYFYKLKLYSLKKSFCLVLITTAVGNNSVFLFWMNIFPLFFPGFQRHYFVLAISYAIFFTAIVMLFLKITKNIRKQISNNEKFLAALFIVSIIILAFHFLPLTLHQNSDPWQIILRYCLIAALIISLLFYIKVLIASFELEQRTAEQEALYYYTNEIEQQQMAMRKFKHDYINILTSIRGYIKDRNWDELEYYFDTKIEPSSAVIVEHDFSYAGLSKIKDKAVKGLLISKLLLAQNLDVDIRFEVKDDVERLLVDSITLVRILGIVFDNAIEEVVQLGYGGVEFACYSLDLGFVFIVKNTCREDIDSIKTIRKAGYSTKGEHRGLGLSNLSEMVAADSNVLTLQTSVSNGSFTQKLWVCGENENA